MPQQHDDLAEIKVAQDFSEFPGGRLEKYGPFSGEQFREQYLLPALRRAVETNVRLRVVLDGAAGYPGSFLDEAFAGIVRSGEFSLKQLEIGLEIVAVAPMMQVSKDLAWSYMRAADRQIVQH